MSADNQDQSGKQPPRRRAPIDWEEIDRWRHVPGPEKVLIGLRLQELARQLALAGIRHQHPEADEREVLRLLRERMELRR
jgi:hypothetical protein